VHNFSVVFLPDSLFTYYLQSLTYFVDTFFLIISQISSLSTTSDFGAKLLSLYLFSFFFSGKVAKKAVIYSFYTQME